MQGLKAQTSLSAEELFQQARSLAIDKHDHPGARVCINEALVLSPGDPDIRIFSGRLYAWDHQPDSARQAFERVLSEHPKYEDGYIAYADLEYWNDNNSHALALCSRGLDLHAGSTALLQRRAVILSAEHRYAESKAAADSALAADPKNTAVRALLARIREYTSANKIGVAYDHVYFDRQYNDPWELVSIDYSRRTRIGTVVGRLNYANRFRSGGVQGEVDAYPHLSKLFYAYVNFGYSGNEGIFPRYRAGASLYANLPYAFEADGGLRYLYFSDNTWVYTFSVGKYYKSFWFNARTYLVPGGNAISQSFTLTGRWYTGGADDYFSFGVGTGISPDDRSNNQQLASPYSLKSHKIDAGWRKSFGKLNIFYVNVQWLDQEYLPKTHGNQVDLGIGYQRRF
jgi:YaiO family outer membrane protein